MRQLSQSNQITELVRIFKIRTDLVELHNIESWANRSKKNKYGDYTILYIVLNDLKKLKIKSYHYSNFHQLAVKLTHHKPINEELQKELLLKEYRQSSFCICFYWMHFHILRSKKL